ncbi:antibiotic biosynthesis monooxygenase [Burkholderia cenocepacia]|uniref:putative quinol monooxygenase n=1 Tax=Burkholderia cepacia complex TaxID=87882 RepID=UPI001BA238C7|nr:MULTISPECIES: putative quinol monooxygenase [Burkholderia cepacia complex]MBR8173728.1 antibiotic biosynthesis monooxygenase [Burkholderia cenocepacia]MCO8320314.1 antibiotic biosynthesis monooxygenase [Burkholderia multivorans]HDV6321248.1 antibiotic biosynthesis monooxygenase [Burkholderia multivorans]
MILVIARAAIRPGMHRKLRDIAHALQHEHAPHEDGCLQYDTFIDGDTLVILDQWRDQTALDAHLQAPHVVRYAPQIKDCVVDGRIDLQIVHANEVNFLQF